MDLFDYCFSENGLCAYKGGNLLGNKSISDEIPNDRFKEFINFVLLYLATEVDCPVKRGTFIEYRTGMINISPVGRNCSREERNEFEKYDEVHHVRSKMVKTLQEKFPDLPFVYSIGGQISFDVFPKGWDKTYCLRYLDDFEDIYFFGDKTAKGGNDYEIYSSDRTIGHSVTCPEDTLRLLAAIFHI
jgi:phosphomannomutase